MLVKAAYAPHHQTVGRVDSLSAAIDIDEHDNDRGDGNQSHWDKEEELRSARRLNKRVEGSLTL